ncbi:MAG: hypothetical protein L0K65_09300 [Actinomyces sp.]|nr:hypothetical protein [Actinomyces sp.]
MFTQFVVSSTVGTGMGLDQTLRDDLAKASVTPDARSWWGRGVDAGRSDRLAHRWAGVRALFRLDFEGEVEGEPACVGGLTPGGGVTASLWNPGEGLESRLRSWGLRMDIEHYGAHLWRGVAPLSAVSRLWVDVQRIFPCPAGVPGWWTGHHEVDPAEVLGAGTMPLGEVALPMPEEWEAAFYRPDLVGGGPAAEGGYAWGATPRARATSAWSEERWRSELPPLQYWMLRAGRVGVPSRCTQEPVPGDIVCAVCAEVLVPRGRWHWSALPRSARFWVREHRFVVSARPLHVDWERQYWSNQDWVGSCPGCGCVLARMSPPRSLLPGEEDHPFVIPAEGAVTTSA